MWVPILSGLTVCAFIVFGWMWTMGAFDPNQIRYDKERRAYQNSKRGQK